MAYLDVISLETAKNWLKIEDTETTDNLLITMLIESCLEFIEQETNILVYSRSKEYLFLDGCVRVYDYPINTLTSPSDAVRHEKTLYSNYTASVEDSTKLVLNVGYVNANDVESRIKTIALYIIDWLYYSKDEKKMLSTELLPAPIKVMLFQLKRFII